MATSRRIGLSLTREQQKAILKIAAELGLSTDALLTLLLEAGVESLARSSLSLPLFPEEGPDALLKQIRAKAAALRPPGNIVKLVTHRSEPYLDYTIAGYFDDCPELRRAARVLEFDHGIYLIGQLVNMTEAELRIFPSMSDDVIAKFSTELARIGLGFGMHLNRWRDPGPLAYQVGAD